MSATGTTSLASSAKRWHRHLTEVCVEYRGLQQERERGWHSAALDRWYAERHATPPSATSTATANAPHTKPLASTSQSSSSAVTSSFQDSDVRVLCERYRTHVQRITSTAPALQQLFASARDEPSSSSSSLSRSKTFVDLGCAPGGVSKYLCENLLWRGVGVTLADDVGGIAMDPDLLARHARTVPIAAAALASGGASSRLRPGSFLLLAGDVADPVTAWSVHDTTSNNTHTTSTSPSSSMPLLTAREALRVTANDRTQEPRFDFVNGGAVQDHGQRQGEASGHSQSNKQVVKRPREESEDEVSVEAGDAILPWFTLFVPQLRFALTHVADGGSMMIVYGVPQCASCCIWLRALETFLEPDVHTESRVRILETMHFVKSPVYILWSQVRVTDRAEALTRLMAAAEPTSTVLCPLPLASLRSDTQRRLAVEAEEVLAGLPVSDRTAFKRQFWLGESDLGFELASEGFDTYGPALGKLWERCHRLIAARRARAEAAMAAASAPAPLCSTGTAAPPATSAPSSGSKQTRRGRGTFHV